MTKPRKKAPSKRAARKNKPPVSDLAAPTPDQKAETPAPTPELTPLTKGQADAKPLVAPMDGNTFQLVIAIIDNADFKGHESGKVLAVKMELARVAGLRQVSGDGQ